jgi:DNA polymerase epsilon subunit 1
MAPFKPRGRGSYSSFRGRGRGGYKPGGGRGGGTKGPGGVNRTADGLVLENDQDREGTESLEKWNRAQQDREIDESLGFVRFDQGPPRVGWLINIQPVSLPSPSIPHSSSCSL